MAISRKRVRTTEESQWQLGEAFEEFMAEKEGSGKSASTLRNYRQSFGYFMEFCDLEPTDTMDVVDVSMFYKWSGNMALEGVKHTSINHYLRDVRAFFYWCMEEPREYLKQFKIKEVSGQEEVIKFFSDEELELLLEKPSRKAQYAEWRTYTIVNWVLATGNRASTICNVRVGDVDFKKKEIVLAHTKNKMAQIIPLSSSLEATLKEYMRLFAFDKDTTNPWLFSRVDEEQLTTNALRHAFRKYCLDRGIEHTNIHGLRHNFARSWIKNNGNMFALQKILGHQTLDMTRRYVKLFSDDIKTDFDKFNPLDNIKRKSKRTQTIKRNDY